MCEAKPVVILTGFGPYAGYPVNASWEAVRHVNKNEIENKLNIQLIREEVSTIYRNVDNQIPRLWNTYKPKLVIHVAVTRDTNNFKLESVAYKNGYSTTRDNNNEYPGNFMSPAQGAPVMQTKLDLEKIISEFSSGYNNFITLCNDNNYRNLSGYTLYTSLCFDDTRTLFVRVPDRNLMTSEESARGLERLIELCLKQIDMRTPIAPKVSDQVVQKTDTSEQAARGPEGDIKSCKKENNIGTLILPNLMSSEEAARGLEKLIELCLKQIDMRTPIAPKVPDQAAGRPEGDIKDINIGTLILPYFPRCLLNAHKHWFILLLLLIFILILTFLLFIIIFY